MSEAAKGCVGREQELGELASLYEAAVRGSAPVAVVTGPAGIGKSVLLAELRARLAAAGVPVFEGRFGAGGGPYQAVRELVEAALARLADLGAGASLVARGAQLAAALSGQLPGEGKAPTPIDGRERRLAFFERVRDWLCAVSRLRPPAFVLHDAHLADGAARALLDYLVRSLAPPPGWTVGDDFRGLLVLSCADPAVFGWHGDVAAKLLPLGGLDRDGVRAFLSAPRVVERLHARSGGQPGALEALLDAGAPELSPPALALARTLAILGRPAGPALLARLGGSKGAIVELAGSPLCERTLAQGELRLSLARGREAVLEGLGARERAALHLAIGQALLELERAGAEVDPIEPAEHLLAGGGGEVAVDAALRAAERLEHAFAFERAALLYARALGETRRPEVAESMEARLVDLHELSGDYAGALEAARRRAARPGASAEDLWRVGHLELLRGELPAARDTLARARRMADQPLTLARALADSAEASFLLGDHEAALADGAAAMSQDQGAEAARARNGARNSIGKVHLERGEVAEAERAFAANLEEARRAGFAGEATRALVNLGVAAIRLGAHAQAEARYREALAAADASSDVRHRAFCLQNLGVLAQWRRDYRGALEKYQQAVQAFKKLGHRPWLAWVALDLGDLYLGLGDDGRAEAMADLAARLVGEPAPPTAQVILGNLRGRIALGRGDLGAARGLLERALEIARRVGNRDETTLVELYLARVELAERGGAAALARLQGIDVPAGRLAAQARLLAGEARLEAGDRAGARAELEAAAAAHAELADGEGELRALAFLARADGRAGARALERARALEAELRANVPEEFAGSYLKDLRPRTSGLESDPKPEARAPRPGRPQVPRLVGDHPRLRDVQGMIERVAPHDSTILVRGESGTGKELVAEAIHELSPRRHRPFVRVNSAALVDTLLLSELFGHERGAFTGAVSRKKGWFEAADGGTIFLDEIGDVSPAAQAALLRVLQTRQFERVGGTETIRVDVRVICATNRPLEQMVAEGRFREDLYYRLRGIEIEMPPLRERASDLARLAEHLLARLAREEGGRPRRLSAAALARLATHPWPGNVRELENVLRSACTFADGTEIDAGDVEPYLRVGESSGSFAVPVRAAAPAEPDLYTRARQDGLRELKRRIEADCIARALDEAEGNITRAAQILKMKRPRLSQLLKEHGMTPKEKKR